MNNVLEKLEDNLQKRLQEESIPEWISPMLATLTDDYFSDPEWVFERKVDGQRCICYSKNGSVRLGSRNKKDITNKYPEIEKALKGLPNAILDGELVAFDGEITSFSRLQPRMQNEDPDPEMIENTPVYYYLFDIMHLDGYNLTELPLRKRKSILRKLIDYGGRIRYMSHRNEDGKSFHKEACENGWEGIIAKKAESTYVHSRSKNWLKFKCINQQEMVIGGYTEPQGERIGFGALHVGYYEDDKLMYAGKVGTGFDDQTLKSLHNKMNSKEQQECPFDEEVQAKHTHWIKPELVAEIGFTEWTEDGKLRHPRFLGLRTDKPAGKVTRETPS